MSVVALVVLLVTVAVYVAVRRIVFGGVQRETNANFDLLEREAVPAFFRSEKEQMERFVLAQTGRMQTVLDDLDGAAHQPGGDTLPAANSALEKSMRNRESLGGLLAVGDDIITAEGLAFIAADGRVAWSKVGRTSQYGEDWSRFPLVATALSGSNAFAIIGAGDDVPPMIPDVERLYRVLMVPSGKLDGRADSNRAPGAIAVARPLNSEAIASFSASAGTVIVLLSPKGFLVPPNADELGEPAEAVFRLRAAVATGREGEVSLPEPYRYRAVRQGPVEVVLLRSIARERRLVNDVGRALLAVIPLSLAVALLLARAFSASMRDGVQRLVEGTEALRDRRYGHRVEVSTRDELAMLASSLNRMAEQLEKGDFVERTMKMSMPRKYVDYILEHRDELGLEGASRVISCLFCDLGGFTHFSESRAPEEVVKRLNDYFDVSMRVVETYDGMVDKFIGDAVMAVWNAPVSVEGHAAKSLIAALELVSAADYVTTSWGGTGADRLRCRVGVHTGAAVAGHVGGRDQRSYTAVGDTVNLASRLEGANKLYRTRVLTSDATRVLAGDAVQTRFVDRVRVKGRDEPVDVFEVLAEKGSPLPRVAPEAEYRAAWDLYAARKFLDAADAFGRMVLAYPDEHSSVALGARCIQYARSVPDDFDGVFTMEAK